MIPQPAEIYIVYDGDCPFCRNYVRFLRLEESAGIVHLINARQPHPVIGEIKAKGLDLNEGMVVKIANQFYHGAEAIHVLAFMTTPITAFNRITSCVFGSKSLSSLSCFPS